MEESPQWVPFRTVGTVLEAELVRQSLEAGDIPVLVRGNHSGIFGGAYQGAVPGGIELLVPESALARARALVPAADA
ncbi:MAG TPA: DUF2007 domain-containing protein [Gemmatimonadaceae bacterium]|nr:DUF2007 domain-containing protein [Gemmatimonadaceae bacterium]